MPQMKRSWYDVDTYGELVPSGDYKRPALPGRLRTRGSRVPLQGITTTMARSSGRTYKKRSRRRFRGRIFRRRRLRYLQPWSQKVALKTVFGGAFNAGVGTVAAAIWAANGCNDPYLADASAQPLGFDQWSTLYRRYVVIGYRLDIRAIAQDNTNPIVVGITPLTSSTALTSYAQYQEAPGTVFEFMTPDLDKTRLSLKGSVKKFLYGGMRRGGLLADDEVSALTSANPTRPVYLHCWVAAADTAVDPAAVLVNATLHQIVVFFDPIVPGRS